MGVRIYMDVHVPRAITHQLRLRGVDVLTARDDGRTDVSDEDVLLRAGQLGRVVFTQDIRFHAMAGQWQGGGRWFAGLVFGHQLEGTIGQYVRDLEIIAKASDPEEWLNMTARIPF